MVRAVQEETLVEASAVLFARRDGVPRVRHAWEVRSQLRDRRMGRRWSAVDVTFVVSLFAILVLNFLDITITLIHVAATGWASEGNYLIRVLGERGGAMLPVVFKVLVIGGATYLMWRIYQATQAAATTARSKQMQRRTAAILRAQATATFVLLSLYVWVVQHNVRIVWG